MNFLIKFFFSFLLYHDALAKLNWWNHTVIYDIFVWSFKDSNNDGIGDFKGITSKLDYLVELGVPVIKLSQIFSSPDEITDSYAIDDFYKIHHTLGSMSDFEEFIQEANFRGIKVILDINFNHCHQSHEWFQKSLKKIKPYSNYFVWKDGQKDEYFSMNKPPDNWKNALHKNAWHWNHERKQFYYNHFNSFSPDLNLMNYNVKNEIRDILYFWLEKGVSGFNLLNINAYLKEFNSNRHYWSNTDSLNNLNFLRKVRKWIDLYSNSHGDERILTTKLIEMEDNLYQFVFSFQIFHFISVSKLSNFNVRSETPAGFFINEIQYFIQAMPKKMLLEWVLESPDINRIRTYNNKQVAEVLLLLQSVLPGVMRIYYGTELGMSEYFPESRKCVDMKWQYSNNARTLPMQWNSLANAGFSTSDCVLQKPNPNHLLMNVETEKEDINSSYNLVKNLLEVRQDDVLKYGDLEFAHVYNLVLIITRKFEENSIHVIANLNNVSEEVNLFGSKNSLNEAEVLVATPNSFYKKQDKITVPSNLIMRPMSALILKI